MLAGWDAPSAAGFEAFATRAESCAASLVAVGPAAAAILRTYAEELAAAKRAFRQATRDAESAERDLDSADSAKAESRARDDLDDARGAMGDAGQAAVEANHRAAAAIRSLADGIVDPPPVPATPAPGTGLDGGLSDGVLSDLQRLGSHLFSTGATLPDLFTLGFFSQGVEALGDRVGGDWAHLINPDSPGYVGGQVASMATVLGVLRRGGREALEEGGERAVREVRTPPPPPPRLRPNSEIRANGRVFARTDAEGNVVPVPREEGTARLLDPRELRLREEGLAERARPGEQLRHGVPPPNVRTRKEAAVEMFRVLGQTLDDLGG